MEPSECCSSGLLDLECAYCRAVHVSASLEGVEDLCCGGRMLHCFRCGTPVDVLRKRVTFPSGEGPVTGAVRLFREWSLSYQYLGEGVTEVRLRGVNFRFYEYRPGVNEARDMVSFFGGADWQVGRGPGFYGYFDMGEVWNPHLESGVTMPVRVVGTVLGFGKVRFHERGATCEKVVVESLVFDEELIRGIGERAVGVANSYGMKIRKGGREWGEEVKKRYVGLAEYYGCLLIPPDTARGLLTGFLDNQPIPGV